MTTYFNAEINADMIWYSSDALNTAEMQELDSLSAADLIAYAEAVPSWDHLDEGMWDYIAYWYDIPEQDGDEFDPDAFITAAKKPPEWPTKKNNKAGALRLPLCPISPLLFSA